MKRKRGLGGVVRAPSTLHHDFESFLFWLLGGFRALGKKGQTQFLAQLLGLPFLSLGAKAAEEPKKKALKIMMKSAWGSDDPTKAAFPFHHGLALAEAGHEVQIFLLGEATSLMRKVTANAVVPVGWPPLSEAFDKI